MIAALDPLDPARMASLKHWGDPPPHVDLGAMKPHAWVDCGWGRLLLGQTFDSPQALADELRCEAPGQRDVALYIRDPHVAVAVAPQHLFLDPSHTYRLDLKRHRLEPPIEAGYALRAARAEDEAALNRIYRACRMVPLRPGYLADGAARDPAVIVLVVHDQASDQVVGSVTGVDHVRACGCPEQGASLWSLAVAPQAIRPGVGEALVRALAHHYRCQGRRYMDLSVMHDNHHAIALYEKLGFERVPVYCIKHKNPINEKLFTGPDDCAKANIYARILIDEARRRGIGVELQDAEHGFFRLTHGGRTVNCRESLSDLTSAVAMSRCDDKRVTHKVLSAAGLRLPAQTTVRDEAQVADFVRRHGRVVVKPARGEQGRGVSVDLRTLQEVQRAIDSARAHCDEVILEELVQGLDLRIVVIDDHVVAAATRRPAEITGDGQTTVRDLIVKQSRRREAATAGESRIPLDAETERCVRAAGYTLKTVLPLGLVLPVRKTANLHTGGTLQDVTERLHPTLREVAQRAARALDIPVVGLDLIVPRLDGPQYAIIEANERPGLANHEPQPTAERFIDLLFPQTRATPLPQTKDSS
ncbi:N-acetylglutaminylglutamine synthetase [Caldimonas taiwanensis]|uniref:N-acetylglutaminylglutamine synthetase n=1 Tax=Caldimonas taiwanensis TaxID=307483 RepID=UPI0007842FE1|nr:N-acetylglutaminylglutamine synthetase [Caldimonas taiwanensis]